MSISSKFEQIHDVSRDMLSNANDYANASRHSDRHGTSEQIGKWFQDVRVLNYARPFFRTIEGYDNTYFVLDIDVSIPNEKHIEKYYTEDELRQIKIKASAQYFEEWLNNKEGLDFFKYISGKGLYLIQKYEKAVPKEAFLPIVWNGKEGLFTPCTGNHKKPKLTCDGWHLYDGELVRQIMYDHIEITLKIDLRMMNGIGGRLFRVPYSPYYKLDGIYHCVPVLFRKDGSWDIDATIENCYLHQMKVEPYTIPIFQFESKLEELGSLEQSIKRRNIRTASFIYKINVPEPDEELNLIQLQMIDEMELMVTGEVDVTPPCMKRSFLRDPENPVDRHFGRVNLLRYLAVKGNYTPSEIGTFIRFKVNDEEDNKSKNKHTLHQQVPYWYGDPKNPDLPPSCDKMQDPKNRFFACGEAEKSICSRTYCLSSQKRKIKKKKFKITRKTDEKKKTDVKAQNNSFAPMGREIRKILKDNNHNYELIKTTRAGVTTSLIKESVQMGKKLLVITPTNAIGEKTGSEAFWLMKVQHQMDIKGAVFSSNKKGCLKLKFRKKDLREKKTQEPNWGESGLAYEKLSFHFKPSCITETDSCKFLNDTFTLPHLDKAGIPLPIIESEVHKYQANNLRWSSGKCSYQSIIQQISELDVLFITYDKLRALSLSEDAVVISELIDIFDIVFLDEISQFAQKNSDSVPLYQLDDEEEEFELIDKLDIELAILQLDKHNKTVQKLVEIIEDFRDEYKNKLLVWESKNKFTKDAFIEKFDNPLSLSNRNYIEEFFSALYGVVAQFAEQYNIHLKYVEKILILLTSESWWVQNIPTNERIIDCNIISAPVVDFARSFVNSFDRYKKKQVIVTDATMPMIKMSQLFGVDFKRYVIGDPRNTNDYQLIITDNKLVYPFRLFMGGKDNYLDSLVEMIQTASVRHGAHNIMLVLPNSRKIYRYIKYLQSDGRISDKLDLTYYRSDKTVGVASDKRIMIAVCAPYPPTGSYLWLASYYHEIGLYSEVPIMRLSKQLEEMNAHQTFYQTIGRAKAPDNAERSIVYAWGIDRKVLSRIIQMDTDVPIPHITSLRYKNSKAEILSHIAELWLQYHVIVNTSVIRLVNYLKKNPKQKYSISMLKRILRLNDKDIAYLKKANPIIFDHFGIYYEKTNKAIYLYADG